VKYPVEANILREATKPEPDPPVIEWRRAHEADTAQAVIAPELRFGILIFQR
jgi:hypothetical protein